jgi:hypothetical protein
MPRRNRLWGFDESERTVLVEATSDLPELRAVVAHAELPPGAPGPAGPGGGRARDGGGASVARSTRWEPHESSERVLRDVRRPGNGLRAAFPSSRQSSTLGIGGLSVLTLYRLNLSSSPL